MDWVSLIDMAAKAGKWMFDEYQHRNSISQEYQRLRQAEEEKKSGLSSYLNGDWENAIFHFEAAKRLNPNITGINSYLATARDRLARRKMIIFFIRLALLIALVSTVVYLMQ